MYTIPPKTLKEATLTPHHDPFSRRVKIFVLLLLLITAASVSFWIYTNHVSADSLDATEVFTKDLVSTSSKPTSAELTTTLQAIIDDHPNVTIGLNVTDMLTGQQIEIHGDTVFTAASTGKVLVASLYLHGVETGMYTLNDALGATTQQAALAQMITQSNNDAWMNLNDLLGYATETSYGQHVGMKQYESTANTITPNDQALLLSELYQGKLLNSEHTQLLLSLMTNTNVENLIPAGAPASATVYHKYGTLDGNLHDSAIIRDGNHAFVLTIYTNSSNLSDYGDRVSLIQEITKAVTAYEEAQS